MLLLPVGKAVEGPVLCVVCEILPCPFPVAAVFCHTGLDICSRLCNA